MSYILEALRRAEQQRRRAPAEVAAAVTAGPLRQRSRYRLASGTILVLAGVLAGTLLALHGPALVARLSMPRPAPPESARPAVVESDTPLPAPATVPYAQLPETLRRELGPVHLDLHVYGERPERRFVLINSVRYRAGDWLDNGALLEAITADGALLSYRDRRFTLSNQPP
ncbi:MAG: general secretion pathway protein GspB [Candidatus Competibacterales bacterium]|nr:general secretion pathway protein GspB [Candidatus Competibacterales bacterium]